MEETGLKQQVSSKYRHPDAANFNAWRRHLLLADPNPTEELIFAWEDVKAMFNGGNRKKMNNLSISQHTSDNDENDAGEERSPSKRFCPKTTMTIEPASSLPDARASQLDLMNLPGTGTDYPLSANSFLLNYQEILSSILVNSELKQIRDYEVKVPSSAMQWTPAAPSLPSKPASDLGLLTGNPIPAKAENKWLENIATEIFEMGSTGSTFLPTVVPWALTLRNYLEKVNQGIYIPPPPPPIS